MPKEAIFSAYFWQVAVTPMASDSTSVYASVKHILNFRCCFYSFSNSPDFHQKTVSVVSVG